MRPRCILIVDRDLVALNDVAACIRRMFVDWQVVVAPNGRWPGDGFVSGLLTWCWSAMTSLG
jgi:hypothetical protein